jgi:hypothetical protein
MELTDLFLSFHEGKGIPDIAIDGLFDLLSDDQLRCQPQPVLNSVARNIWHMARAEDIGGNRIVSDSTQ